MIEMKKNAKTKNARTGRPMLGLDLHSWETAMLMSLAIAAVAAIAVGVATAVVVNLQRHEVSAAAEELAQYKADAAARIAEASAIAAKAHERAAEAELKAAEANEAAEKERRARMELEAKFAPRRITQEQQNSIKAKLSTFKGKTVWIEAPDSHPNEIAWLMRWLGAVFPDDWSRSFRRAAHITMHPSGVIVRSSDVPEAREIASVIASELTATGVSTTALVQPGIAADEFILYVGEKP